MEVGFSNGALIHRKRRCAPSGVVALSERDGETPNPRTKATEIPRPHMLTLRPLNADGTWGAKSRKVYELDADGNRIPDGKGSCKNHRKDTTDWNNKGNAEKWRAAWAAHINKAVKRSGGAGSYKRQGVDKIPSIHMGVAAMRMENRGVLTIKGDFNRAVAADNKLLKELKARITRLYDWSGELAAREKTLQGGRKQSVMAQLMDAQMARQKEGTSNSNYSNPT